MYKLRETRKDRAETLVTGRGGQTRTRFSIDSTAGITRRIRVRNAESERTLTPPIATRD